MNPYSGASFFDFFQILIQRIGASFLSQGHLVSDELQLLALLGVAVSGSILGCILYMKKMTMVAGALSHTVLLGIVTSFLILKAAGAVFVSPYALSTLLLGSFIAAGLTLVLTEVLHKKLRVEKGASIGLVFTTLFAISLVLVSIYLKNTHIGLDSIMGNIDGLQKGDLKPIGILAAMNLAFFVLYFRGLMVDAFDPLFGSVIGIRSGVFRFLLMALLAVSATLFFKIVGVFLFLAFLVVPLFLLRRWTHDLKKLVVASALLSSFSALIGVALSRHLLSVYGLPLSSSAIVALTIWGLGGVLYGLQWCKTVVINRKGRYAANKVLDQFT